MDETVHTNPCGEEKIRCLTAALVEFCKVYFWLMEKHIFFHLDLFKVIFYGFYHGKSPLNHHLGEYFSQPP